MYIPDSISPHPWLLTKEILHPTGQVESLAKFAERELGHIDLWVNNAALSASSQADVTQV